MNSGGQKNGPGNGNKNKKQPPKKNNWLVLGVYFLIIISVVGAFRMFTSSNNNQEITYDKFLEMVEEDKVKSVDISSDGFKITPKNEAEYGDKTLYTAYLRDDNLIQKLEEHDVEFKGIANKDYSFLSLLISCIAPTLLILILIKFVFSKVGSGGSGVMGIGKNNAKIYTESEIKVTFDDVAGQEEAKESLKEIIDFLNCPKKYTEIGAKLPKGVLLVGPPGTGKTLIAKAVAGEAKVPFFSLSGSSFVEMFVGVGASRVRELFKDAEAKAPCIVFIDEIDAIGKSRDNQMQSNDEREQTLNQLLSEMDGFDSSKGIVILGATNRPEILDKALLRPGRFDRRVIVDRPEFKGREAILKVHAKNIILDDDVDLVEIARSTPGAVGADLANIINEAALRAVRKGRKRVIQADLREAVEVIIAGKEKKDAILSEKERQIVSYHEVGHALVAAMLKGTKPVHKITIVPRMSGSLGYTMQIEDEEEKFLSTKEELLNEITILTGGRAAEEVKFNLITSGASNDMEKATQLARAMVSMYGMSETFDMMATESVQNKYLDGRAVRNCSEETATTLDREALAIIKSCHERAKKILSDNMKLLDKVSDVLIQKENIFGDEFMELVYEEYPEKKAEAEKEKVEKEKRIKEVEERRAKRIAEDEEIEKIAALTDEKYAKHEPEVSDENKVLSPEDLIQQQIDMYINQVPANNTEETAKVNLDKKEEPEENPEETSEKAEQPEKESSSEDKVSETEKSEPENKDDNDNK